MIAGIGDDEVEHGIDRCRPAGRGKRSNVGTNSRSPVRVGTEEALHRGVLTARVSAIGRSPFNRAVACWNRKSAAPSTARRLQSSGDQTDPAAVLFLHEVAEHVAHVVVGELAEDERIGSPPGTRDCCGRAGRARCGVASSQPQEFWQAGVRTSSAGTADLDEDDGAVVLHLADLTSVLVRAGPAQASSLATAGTATVVVTARCPFRSCGRCASPLGPR